jgi:hypothetical protein
MVFLYEQDYIQGDNDSARHTFPNHTFRKVYDDAQDVTTVWVKVPFDLHINDILEIEYNVPADVYQYVNTHLYAMNKQNPGNTMTIMPFSYNSDYFCESNRLMSLKLYASNFTNRIVLSGELVKYIKTLIFPDIYNADLLTKTTNQLVYSTTINKTLYIDEMPSVYVEFNEEFDTQNRKTRLNVYGYCVATNDC